MIVYLHGFASGPGSKKAQYFRQRFAELGVALEIPDLAEGSFESLTISGQLALIARLCAGAPATLIGSSMGGYLAALYAARHPEVKRLVLMAPAFGFARRWEEWLGPAKIEEWKRNGYIEMYHYAEQRNSRVGYQLLEDGARYEDYPEVTQPVLIFHGRHDTVVLPRYAGEFAAGRANVRLEILDSDHELLNVLPEMWEQTRAFVR